MKKIFYIIILLYSASVFALGNSEFLYKVDLIIFANNEPDTEAETLKNPPVTGLKQAKPLRSSLASMDPKGNLANKSEGQKIVHRGESQQQVLAEDEIEKNEVYSLLSDKDFNLKNEYKKLKYSKKYRVLGHYSWLGKRAEGKRVALPEIEEDDWQITGDIWVRERNYFDFDAELIARNANSQFYFTQDLRLRNGAVYYLDHPLIGMIVKVQQLKPDVKSS